MPFGQDLQNNIQHGLRFGLALTEAGRQMLALEQQREQQEFENEIQQALQSLRVREAGQRDRDLTQRETEFQSAEQQRRIGNLAGVLKEGGRPVQKSADGGYYEAPAQFGRVDPGSVLDLGDTAYQMPSAEEQSQRELEARVKQARALQGVTEEGFPQLGADLAEAAGLPGGSRVSPAVYSAIQRLYSAANKPAPQPRPLHFQSSTSEEGDYITQAFDPDTGEKRSETVRKGGGKRGAEDGAKPPTRAQFTPIEARKDKTLADSKKQRDKDLEDAKDVLGDTDAAKVRAAQERHLERVRDAQTAYENEIGALTGKPVEHNDWADRLQTPDASGQTRTEGSSGQGSGGASKSATAAQVKAYAQKKGVSLNQAQQEFKQAGYQVK